MDRKSDTLLPLPRSRPQEQNDPAHRSGLLGAEYSALHYIRLLVCRFLAVRTVVSSPVFDGSVDGGDVLVVTVLRDSMDIKADLQACDHLDAI